ncbi:MAG: DNA mismatch repair protein MutS [Moraxellaceae bacterium]|nr:MAG: DNA mismatch repair protein MutS [Moraxellaceae bacterium]
MEGQSISFGSQSSSNPLAGLNPADIDNIQILQGPSATAVYGSRATNGVVLITTKRGKAGEAKLSYRLATLQHRVFEQLKTGNLRWYEAVDLHGCTVEQARSAVLQIVEMARTENQNVIKIVHGKGPQAILKTYVNSWLRQHRDVLAFVSAPPDQGGTGAVLVLLKRAESTTTPAKK